MAHKIINSFVFLFVFYFFSLLPDVVALEKTMSFLLAVVISNLHVPQYVSRM
jgi:hypothetical protein